MSRWPRNEPGYAHEWHMNSSGQWTRGDGHLGSLADIGRPDRRLTTATLSAICAGESVHGHLVKTNLVPLDRGPQAESPLPIARCCRSTRIPGWCSCGSWISQPRREMPRTKICEPHQLARDASRIETHVLRGTPGEQMLSAAAASLAGR